MLEVAKPQPLTRAEESLKKEEAKPLVERMTPETGRARRWSEKDAWSFSLSVAAPSLLDTPAFLVVCLS